MERVSRERERDRKERQWSVEERYQTQWVRMDCDVECVVSGVLTGRLG